MHSDFNNIKMSNNLKDRIKAGYKEEKVKPKYKVRKALNYEIEIPKVVVGMVLVAAVMTPVIESINKVRELTYYKVGTIDHLEDDVNKGREFDGKEGKNKE